MHTVIIGPEVIRNTVFEQFCCVNGTPKRHFKIVDNNKVGNKIYNGTWELVESGKILYFQLFTHINANRFGGELCFLETIITFNQNTISSWSLS